MALAVNTAARVWTPFKELQVAVEAAIHKKQPEAIHDLEVMLRRHKADFIALLKNMPKNAQHRAAIRKSTTVGLPIHGEQRTQTFPEAFVEEALIISDLFDLDEYAALELLISGEDNKPDFPGLTRGLVAVLLYYDGRRSIVVALRTLMLSLEGYTYTLDLQADLTHLTNKYINQLVQENLVNKILAVIKDMDVTKELDRLQSKQALGPPKHRKQIQDIYSEIKLTCAECLFWLACQRPLSKADTLQVISHLKADNSLTADGTLSSVTLSLLMALLYCFDVSVLEREDVEEITQRMPVFSDPNYIQVVHKELRNGAQWKTPGLKAVVQFAWSLMLRQLSQFPLAAGAGDCYDEDEVLMDTAIEGQVFHFLRESVIAVDTFHKEDFYVRRLHGLLTDFIYHMPLKVKEVRNHGDETARIILAHLQENQEPPATLRRDFEHFMGLIHTLYEKDPLGLELSLDYWCPEPVGGHDARHHRPPQRQVALYKFVRMAGDLLPPGLYVPYINMLTGLASGNESAQHCFNLLKINGSTSSTVSWDHIFQSLNQYFTSLRRESPNSSDVSHVYRSYARVITPQELEGLISVLQLTRRVCEQSENCRVAVWETQHWSVVMLLFGLVTCSVPPQMKSELLLTLSAVAHTPVIAATMWETLEASQILVTVPTPGDKMVGGMQVELEEVETRNEEYPMTRAFLQLLASLTDTPPPAALGAGARAPGFEPYLQFIRDDVLLKFNSRAYKNAAEKWEVAAGALGILRKLLHNYEVQPEHLEDQILEVQGGNPVLANKPAGFTILVSMLRDSRLLQMVLRILDDAMRHLQTYTSTPGSDWLEKCALLCLQLLEDALTHEELFVDIVRDSGSSLIVTPLNRLLLGINHRTGKADHIVTVAKYLMFNSRLPEHSLASSHILLLACKSGVIQSDLVTLFTESKDTSHSLLHGFVECLESDDAEESSQPDSEATKPEMTQEEMRNTTRQHLLKLMIHTLDQSSPNLAHFLLGFEICKPVYKTTLQDPGVLNSPKTCLHSILTILGRGLGTSSGPSCLADTPCLAELCYRVIYMLSANKDTSLPTLRYLRTSHDFLYRQVQHLPFDQKIYRTSVSKHQSWLLKTVAVELRVTSINRQRSHTQRLLKLILDDYDEEETTVLQLAGQTANDSELLPFSRYGEKSTSQYGRAMRGRQYRRRIMSILDTLQFEQAYPEQLMLSYFDTGRIQQVIASVEGRDEEGVVFYNAKTLYRVLMNEVNNAQGATMVGQRNMILEEIGQILRTVIDRNKVCQSLHAKHEAFEAWRQVTEIILTACPEDLLQGETRQTVLFEILQDLLLKVSDDNALTDLTAPVAGVILTLLANLRQCFLTEDSGSQEKDKRDSQYISMLDKTHESTASVTWGQGSGSRTLFATSLQVVLKGLIEHIMRSSGGQQRVRAKLYGALLYYLQIANKPKPPQLHLQEEQVSGIEARVLAADSEYEHLRKENISTILSYGDVFMELVCKDACDGIDVGRMLALSVLDSILQMDKFSQWMTFLSSKGYLEHLVGSIGADDSMLVSVLTGGADSLRVLYLFESKMSFLTRVAESAEGANLLLRFGVMTQLASCTFFDMRPEVDRSLQSGPQDDDSFLPDPISRYRQLFFTTLKFCLAILTSLGIENTEAGVQVMQFIVAHGDLFHAILRDRQPVLNLHALQELALTTAVISRANYYDEDQYEPMDTAAIELCGQRARIQRQMVALLPRYCLSERNNKQLRNLEQSNKSGDVKAKVTQAFLEVATNVTTYCRALVSTSGTSSQFFHVLFGPGLDEALSRDLLNTGRNGDFLASGTNPNCYPNLGVVVFQLKQCTNQFMSVYEERKQHLSKLEGLSELSVEDLKQFSGVGSGEKMSSQQRQALAKKRLSQLIMFNYQELQAFSYIIENCLFLLWRHLEYYLVYCVPSDQMRMSSHSQSHRQQRLRRLEGLVGVSASPQIQGVPESLERDRSKHLVTDDEIATLKQAAVSILGESLFKKVKEINQTFSKSRSHYGFVEAVVRRIQRLLRLHTTNR